jgi:NDP-sugar pyrophosphorylase family protein
VKAGIIAAGEGSRLRADGFSVPKPLVSVDGMPLIERLIGTMIRQGINEIACIVNEESIAVRDFVNQKSFPIPVHCVVKSTPSSMHSLFALSPLLSDGRFLLSTVDSIFREEEFADYLRYSSTTEADGILAVTSYIDDENPLYADLDDRRRIRSFSKTDRAPWVTGGLYVLSPRIFDEIEPVRKNGIERLRNFLSHLVTAGYRLEGFPFSKIVDVDRGSDVRAAEEFLRPNAGSTNA